MKNRVGRISKRLIITWVSLVFMNIFAGAPAVMAASPTDDYYRLVDDIQVAYFQLDYNASLAIIETQQKKAVANPRSTEQKIDTVNYWLTLTRYNRLWGHRTALDSNLAAARQVIESITDSQIQPTLRAHAAIEGAEAEILFGNPLAATRLLDGLTSSSDKTTPEIAARVASARAAISMANKSQRKAYDQARKSLLAFESAGENGADYLIAKARQLATLDRVGAPQAPQQIEKFVNDAVGGPIPRYMLFAEIIHTVGIAAFGENTAAETANIFRQVLIRAELPQTHPLTFSAEMALIGSDLMVGKLADSLRKSFALQQSFGDRQPAPSLNLSDLYMQIAGASVVLGETKIPEIFAQAALDISEQIAPRESPYHQLKLLDAADVFSQLEKRQTASDLITQIDVKTLGQNSGLGDALIIVRLAGIYDSLGDLQNAERAYRQAYRQLPENALDSIFNYAVIEPYSSAMYKLGDHVQALAATRRAVGMMRNIVARETSLLGPQQFDPAQGQRIRTLRSGNASVVNRMLLLLSNLPEEQLSADVRNEAFVAAQFANGSKIEDTLSKVAQRASLQSPEMATMLRTKQDLSRQIGQATEQLSFLRAGLPAETNNQQSINQTQSTLESLRRQQFDVEKQFRLRFPKVDGAITLPILSIQEVQSQLADDDAVLLFYQTSSKVLLWTITNNTEDFTSLAARPDQVLLAVNSIRKSLSVAATTRGADAMDEPDEPTVAPFDRTSAHSLHQMLLKPVWSKIADKRMLYVSANGPLTSLPFSLFVTDPPEGDDTSPGDLRSTSWLVESHATVTLPSLSYLKVFDDIDDANGNSDQNGEPVQFAGFGNPIFSGGSTETSASSRNSLTSQLNGLDPLPNTKRELSAMADIFKSEQAQLFLGKAATETNVKQSDLESTNVLAFATHALLSTDIPGITEPSIVFTPPKQGTDMDDGVLTASELSLLKIGADWLIFSACNTAGPDGSPGGEGLSGLASAGLYAGAKSLLVSHWPVFDDAAADITTKTLNRYYGGRSISQAEALRSAMLGLIADDSNPLYAHPAAWAPFVLVGGLQH